MTKQKVWFKQRTSRGNGRTVNHAPRFSWRNLKRELIKNQLAYTSKLFKLVVIFIISLVWIGLGGSYYGIVSLPIGAIFGLVLTAIESSRRLQFAECIVLLLAISLSWFYPIGLVL